MAAALQGLPCCNIKWFDNNRKLLSARNQHGGIHGDNDTILFGLNNDFPAALDIYGCTQGATDIKINLHLPVMFRKCPNGI